MAVLNNGKSANQEFLLMALETDATAKLLEDPNVFIGDTGALSDTTLSDLGFKNVCRASWLDRIVDASGHNLSGKTVGHVSGNFCNKYGEEVGYATMKEMVHFYRILDVYVYK